MRFLSAKVSGILPFREEVAVDFRMLPLLVALVGENGAGKSMFLESLVGAVTRELPTRGLFSAIPATAEQRSLRVELETDRPWTLAHTVDVASGKQKCEAFEAGALVVGADGNVVNTPKRFDAWSARVMPSTDVLLASTIAIQAKGGLLKMGAVARKDIILQSRGVNKLEGWATECRAKATKASQDLAMVEQRLTDALGRLGVVDRPIAELVYLAGLEVETCRQVLEHRTTGAGATEAGLAAVREHMAAATKSNAIIERLRAERTAKVAARDAALARIESLTREMHRHHALVARATEIRASIAKSADLGNQIRVLEEKQAEGRGEWSSVQARVTAAEAALAKAQATEKHAGAKAADATERAKQRTEAAKAAEGLPAAREALAKGEADIAAADVELERLAGVQLSGAEGRIDGLRVGLYAIERQTDAPADYAPGVARTTLGADDQAKAAIESLPTAKATAQAAKVAAVDARKRAQLEVQRLEGKRMLADAPHDDEAAAEALRQAVAEREQATGTLAEARDVLGVVTAAGVQRRDEVLALRAQYDAEKGPSEAEALTRAEAATATLGDQLEAAHTELAAAESAVFVLPPVPELETLPDVAAAEKAAKTAHEELVAARTALAEATRKQTEIAAVAEKLTALEAERLAAATEVGDWNRLAADLGRDGLQAMIVDAVGPELTAIANDLLHSCVGPRWTVSVETQRQGGKGQTIEGCEISVFDSRDGIYKAVDKLSGGEAVIIGEAIGLALASSACRYWGVKRPTIIRDESGAAVSPGMGPAYIAMLRRAASAIGASQVLFVSHSREVQALADARLLFQDGRVTVEAA